MLQFRKERAPLSFGNIVVIAIDFVIAVLSATELWSFLNPSLPRLLFWPHAAGLSLASVGTLAAVVCLLARKPSAARGFQAVGAVGGLFLIVSIVLGALVLGMPVLDLCLFYGIPAPVLIGLAAYVRSITRNDDAA